MKILQTGDTHVGMSNYSKLDPETGLDTRLLDFLNTLDFIVETAISQKVDAFIFTGDAYKTRDPSPTQQRGFGERIRKIAKAGIPVVMVVGNHDTPNAEGKANTLDIYSALEIDNVWVSRKPEFLNIPTKSGNLQVVTAPWLHKADFKTLGDRLLSMYEKIKPAEPAILVGHLEVEGASMGSEKGLAIANDVTVPLSLLTDRRLTWVALGHIHKFQELAKNPPVVYAGSPERIDFGEAKENKGIVLIDIPQPGAATYKFIPTPARKFVSLHVSLKPENSDPTKTILEEIGKHDLEGTIVRLAVDIPADLNKEIEIEKIKKALSGAFYTAGISRNVERKERQAIDGQEEVERLSPIEALQKYFASKKYSPEKIKDLEKFASEILS
jgi:exonuclease SbcD